MNQPVNELLSNVNPSLRGAQLCAHALCLNLWDPLKEETS
ncbi:hypothetical protein Lepto7375DRAFT_5410 [Leptolyngbya sp. PCC 7375]|nr:hypothetical protein Lepto7375DRAFT_5410 [Leptolyngbya sp. PCC 7375]